jgi:hypothetical protein
MAKTKLFLIQLLIEADVSEWPDFDERKAAEHLRSAIKLSGEDKVHHIQAYLLARKPDDPEDLVIEKYEDRGFEVEICQDADTVGTDVPSYYVAVYNPKVKNPSSSISGNHPTVEAAKEEARIRVDKRIQRQK